MKKYIFAVLVALFSSLAYSQVTDDAPARKPSPPHIPKKASQPVQPPSTPVEIKEVKVDLPPPSKASLGFYQAALRENFDMMDLYLQQGADINCLNCDDQEQQTILFRLLRQGNFKLGHGNFKLADWLIQRGANINITATLNQSTGVTLAMLAADISSCTSSLSRLDYLIKNGADIKAVDSMGHNALLYIKNWGYIDTKYRTDNAQCVAFVDQLVNNGIDVNHQDRSGATALINAANSESCSPGSIKLLLSYGADPALKDKLGRSALDMAMDRATKSRKGDGCNEVVKILMTPQKVSQSPSIQPTGYANSRPTDNQQSVAIYAGTYGGSFSGDDEGMFQAVILQDGTATATAHSNRYGLTFTSTGKISDDGTIFLGSASTGAEFGGTVNREGVLTGTWKNTPQKLAGSFQGGKGILVTVPPTESLKVIGSVFGSLFKKPQ